MGAPPDPSEPVSSWVKRGSFLPEMCRWLPLPLAWSPDSSLWPMASQGWRLPPAPHSSCPPACHRRASRRGVLPLLGPLSVSSWGWLWLLSLRVLLSRIKKSCSIFPCSAISPPTHRDFLRGSRYRGPRPSLICVCPVCRCLRLETVSRAVAAPDRGVGGGMSSVTRGAARRACSPRPRQPSQCVPKRGSPGVCARASRPAQTGAQSVNPKEPRNGTDTRPSRSPCEWPGCATAWTGDRGVGTQCRSRAGRGGLGSQTTRVCPRRLHIFSGDRRPLSPLHMGRRWPLTPRVTLRVERGEAWPQACSPSSGPGYSGPVRPSEGSVSQTGHRGGEKVSN